MQTLIIMTKCDREECSLTLLEAVFLIVPPFAINVPTWWNIRSYSAQPTKNNSTSNSTSTSTYLLYGLDTPL